MTYLTVRFIFYQFYCRVEIFGKCVEIWFYVDNW